MGVGVGLAVAGLASAGAAAYSASQVPDAPDPINYGQQYREILRAQLRNAPRLLDAHQQYDPQYAALDEQLLLQRLLGSEGGTREEQYTETVNREPRYEMRTRWVGGKPVVEPVLVAGGGPRDVTRTRTVATPGTRGLIDILEQDLQPAQRRIQTEDTRARVAGEVDILRELGPDAIEALKSANPGAAGLIDELTRQASEELKLGGKMSGEQLDLVRSNVRAGQAARGMGFSPSDIYAEALQTADAQEALKASRRSFAANTASLNAGFAGDAYQRFFGRSSGATPSAGAFVPYGASGSRAPFNPESPMAQDIIGFNANAEQSDYNAGQAGFNNTLNAGMGVFGDSLAAYIRAQGGSNPGINITPGQPTTYNTPRSAGLAMRNLGYI